MSTEDPADGEAERFFSEGERGAYGGGPESLAPLAADLDEASPEPSELAWAERRARFGRMVAWTVTGLAAFAVLAPLAALTRRSSQNTSAAPVSAGPSPSPLAVESALLAPAPESTPLAPESTPLAPESTPLAPESTPLEVSIPPVTLSAPAPVAPTLAPSEKPAVKKLAPRSPPVPESPFMSAAARAKASAPAAAAPSASAPAPAPAKAGHTVAIRRFPDLS